MARVLVGKTWVLLRKVLAEMGFFTGNSEMDNGSGGKEESKGVEHEW